MQKAKMTLLRNHYLNVCCFLCLILGHSVLGQENWQVNTIDPTLLTDTDVVIRLSEKYWTVQTKGQAKYVNRQVVTILNEAGENKYSESMVQYDKFTKIVSMEGFFYDEAGKLLKKIKKSDIQDFSYGIGSDEITDGRMKLMGFGNKNHPYPYTVEYVYEVKDKNLMFYPQWIPTSESRASVEKSAYTIKVPAGFQFQYKAYNGAPEVVKSKDPDGSDLYHWVIQNRPALKSSLYPLPTYDVSPLLLVGPLEFEIQDLQGDFSTWKDIGSFYYSLNKGRDILPVDVVEEIKNLTKNATNEQEKVKLIYKWMQKRTRYVSIQLGIGGWQTIDAATVAKKGYGDCKALTNFMIAALKQVNIESYPALIKAGSGAQIKADFPASQFNHVVACALVANDTIWLECTSQISNPNNMGSFTGDREALLVTNAGGKLVKTPPFHATQNGRNTQVKVSLDSNGDGTIDVDSKFSGLQIEQREKLLHGQTHEAQKSWLMDHLNLPSMELKQFEWKMLEGEQLQLSEKLQMQVRNCASKAGKRLFLKMSLLNEPLAIPAVSARDHDFYLPLSEYAFNHEHTVTYSIPEAYQIETLVPSSQLTSIFGTYELKMELKSNEIVATRKLLLHGGRFAGKDYANWIDFLKKIRKADRAQLVLVASDQ